MPPDAYDAGGGKAGEMSIVSKITTPRVGRQSTDGRDIRFYRSLVGSLVAIHLAGTARVFIGTVEVVDGRLRLLQLAQMGDNRTAVLKIDAVVATEQVEVGETWALVQAEGVA